MTDRRKLQAEIDRVLKKVQEGMSDFEECLDKFNQNSNNPTQKEKYENDLKKEIKKLQRLRDQLKTWIQSSDIKDKTSLVENRKSIESLMERFKVVERETKTKAYSKEGLQAAEKRDLLLEEKEHLTEWINTQLVEFNRQIDVIESEIESLQVSSRKKKTAKDGDRIGRLTAVIERHRYHVYRLEIILRAVDNKAIAPELLTKTPMYVEDDQKADMAEMLANQELDDDGDGGDDYDERPITFCTLIEYYLGHCNDESFREVTDIYEQLAIDEVVDFSLSATVNAQAAPGSTTGTTNPPPSAGSASSSAVPVTASSNNTTTTTQSSAVANTSTTSTSEDKDNERDSRERDRSDQGSHLNSVSEDHNQDDRKRHKSEEKNAQRSKANQQSASASTNPQPHVAIDKSPSAPSKSSSAAVASTAAPAAASTVQAETGSIRVPTPPSVPVPAPAAATMQTPPRSSAPSVARGAPNSYAKSVAGGHPEGANDQPSVNVQLPQPLSYSTVVSSPGISYAAVAAIASASQPQPQSNAASNPPGPFLSSSGNSGAPSTTSNILPQPASSIAGTGSTTAVQQAAPQSVASNLFQPTATSTFPPAAGNSVPPTTPSPQPAGQQAGSFGSQAPAFGSQQAPTAYPLASSPFGSSAQQQQGASESLHTPASLASQAQAAALQNNATAESVALAMRNEQSAQQLAAAAASMQMARVGPPAAMNVQTGLPASSQGAAVSPGAADLTGAVPPFGVNPNAGAGAPFGGFGGSSFTGASTQAGASQATAQAQAQAQPQAKITVQVDPVLGITPFGLKDMQPIHTEHHDLVERARKHMPLPVDSERARVCLPRMPVVTPPYYPQQVPANVDSVDFFTRQQAETLFFVFYYMEGTKAQLLAARALKQLQWRYHSKYLMWFQRLTEPTHMNEEQETGTYIYFDYERWQTKRKEQFTFEFRFLEDKV